MNQMKWSRFVAMLAIVAALLVALVAPTTFTVTAKTTTKATVKFPLTVTDAEKNKVTIKKQPKRIVSLLPSNTEILYAVGAGKKLVAVSSYSDFPDAAKKLPQVSDYQTINVEQIAALKPDLIVENQMGYGAHKEGLKQLKEQFNIPVYVVKNAGSFADTYKTIADIGTIVGHKAEATKVVNKMKADIAAVQAKVKKVAKDKPKTWIEISPAPDLYAIGKGTFMNELLSIAGGVDITNDLAPWAKVSEEEIVKRNPEVIITTNTSKTAVADILGRKAWGDVTAIKAKRVAVVQTDLISRQGPRLPQGVEAVAKLLYPKAFK